MGVVVKNYLFQAVSQAAMRIEKRLKRDKQLSDVHEKTLKFLGENEE